MTESLPNRISPVPSCEEGLRGISGLRMITEIQAPELMDVASVRTLTYARYQALHVSANKAEYGYSQFTASQTSELPTATKPPQTGFMRRLKLVK